MNKIFKNRISVFEVEEGLVLQPKFDDSGLIPVITTSFKDKNVLMHGYMNPKALEISLKTGFAHYWSRSRKCIWFKGETSGLKQKIKEIRIDDDQDCIWISVQISGNGASCHVGYKSCFYRKIDFQKSKTFNLEFVEKVKTFEPSEIYGNIPNPTKL